MKVTQTNFPFVHKAFLLIDLDNGRFNRMDFPDETDVVLAKLEYEVPEGYFNWLKTSDRTLSIMTGAELETITSGEHSDQMKVVAKYGTDGQITNQLLAAYFDGWKS